jgi:hypothetical protein
MSAPQFPGPQFPYAGPPGWQPQPPRKGHALRNVLLGIAGLLVALIVVSVAASGGAAPPPAVTAPAAAPAPLTCEQQAAQWEHANAAVIRRFRAALVPFGGGAVTSAQARALATSAQAAEDVPPPACADPAGYYGQVMANLVTAGTAASGGGALSELGALQPMENASTALSELSAELERTTGSGTL